VHYFSPEQARGTTTTPASDVYGLGLVLFEALTGTRAWTGDTTDAIALARVGKPAPSARAVRPEIPPSLDAVVLRAMAPDPGDRYPNGASMALALEPIVLAADPSSPTAIVAVPTAPPPTAPTPPARSAAGIGRAVPPARTVPPAGRAGRQRTAGGGKSQGPGRPRSILAILGAVSVLGVVLLVAARPGLGNDPGATEPPIPTEVAQATREPTPPATPEPTPAPSVTPEPTAEPTAEPSDVPPGEVADLCEVFFDLPCGLAAGRYAPSRFAPPFDVELGEGWSTAVHREDVVSLTREQGLMTFAGEIIRVFDGGEDGPPRARARDLMEAFIATDGVSATRRVSVRIGGVRGLSADLTPIDSARIELFATVGTTFYLEPDRTTRIVVVDLPRQRTILLAIEPAEGLELTDILESADVAAGTIRWR
jgi:hypothetical protein